jgi:hypothetical protein
MEEVRQTMKKYVLEKVIAPEIRRMYLKVFVFVRNFKNLDP